MEPHFAPMYAKLCRLMNRESKTFISGKLFTQKDESTGLWSCGELGTSNVFVTDAATEEEAMACTVKERNFRRVLANKCQQVSE